MFLSSGLSLALDRIAERAADVRRAFTPGAQSRYDDVATTPSSTFTLDPLSTAAPDGAYFVAAGEGGRKFYTRDGSFVLRGGRLSNAEGEAILGFTPRGNALSELRIDPVDDALGRTGAIGIEPDGSVVYRRITVDPRTGTREPQRVVVGRIALARFPAGTRLETTDGSHLAAPDGAPVHVGLPQDGSFAALAPMRRERSNIDIDESLARLKEAYLAFDALQAAEAAKAHVGKTAMDLVK